MHIPKISLLNPLFLIPFLFSLTYELSLFNIYLTERSSRDLVPVQISENCKFVEFLLDFFFEYFHLTEKTEQNY